MKKTIWYVIGAIVVVVLLVVIGFSLFGRGWDYGAWGMMGPGRMHNWGFTPLGGFGMVLMWLFPILFLVLTVLGIAGLVRWIGSNGRGASPPSGQGDSSPSAREIVQMRYARGEISREEYQQMLEDLGE